MLTPVSLLSIDDTFVVSLSVSTILLCNAIGSSIDDTFSHFPDTLMSILLTISADSIQNVHTPRVTLTVQIQLKVSTPVSLLSIDDTFVVSLSVSTILLCHAIGSSIDDTFIDSMIGLLICLSVSL
jgi:hypothetical protein